MKRCSNCGKRKPLESFYRHHRTKDGRLGRCKACFLNARKTPLERQAERDRQARAYIQPLRDSLGRDYSQRARAYQQLPETTGEWRRVGQCADPRIDPGVFHSADPDDIRFAISMCLVCPVRDQCATEQHLINAPGVWAGVRWIPGPGHRMKPDTRYLRVNT